MLTPGNVMYGAPRAVPVALTRVTPVVKFVRSTCNGPLIGWALVLVTVMVPV